MTLFLYLVTPTQTRGYETYGAFVCVAASEQAASETHPDPDVFWYETRWAHRDTFREPFCSWEWKETPDSVEVTLLGTALPGAVPSVVLVRYTPG